MLSCLGFAGFSDLYAEKNNRLELHLKFDLICIIVLFVLPAVTAALCTSALSQLGNRFLLPFVWGYCFALK